MRRYLLCGLISLMAIGCNAEVTGSAPTIGDSETLLNTDPGFVCNDDPGSWVTLFGADFSPLVVDTIATDEDPDVELPTITFRLSASPTGGAPETEFSITLESPLGQDDGNVRWLDDGTMQFRISAGLELPPGVYDLRVENPNGESSVEEEAFGLIPRPTVHQAIPEMTCVAQGIRDIALEGSDFLILDDAYPTVRLQDEEVEVLEVAGCEELHPVYGGHQLCDAATVRIEEGALEPGVYPVTVENADPAGCTSVHDEDLVTVTIVAPPVVDSIAPTPICGEQLAYDSMEVEGSGFVVLRGTDETAYPTVTIGDEVYTAFEAGGCEPVEDAPVLGAEECTRLTISVGADDLASTVAAGETFGRPNVVVENPEPIGCHSVEDLSLTVVPPPMVAAVAPDPICTAQFGNTLTVDGMGFLTIGDELPQVRIGSEIYDIDAIDDCSSVVNDGPATESCERITVTIPEGDLADPARTDVSVINPATAACESTDDATVHIVAPPMVASINPQPLCTDDDTRTVEIDGEGFLSIDGDLPLVTIDTLEILASGVEDCEELTLDDEEREVLRCNTLLVDIQAGGLTPDVHDVMVTNPESAACSSTEELTVQTVAPPVITSIAPRAICNTDATATFDITGENLFEVSGVAPQIHIDGVTYDTAAEDCENFEDVDDVRICDGLTLDLDPAALSGLLTIVATNPNPIGCSSAESEPFFAAGPPTVVQAVPGAICDDDNFDGALELFGEFVYETDGDLPTVMVDTTPVAINSTGSCETLELGDLSLESCDRINITVPDGIDEDFFEVTVTGASPLACGSDSITVERVASPVITSVIPERICSQGGTLSVQGQNLRDNTEFFLDGIQASTSTVDPDGTSATATFAGPISGDFRTFRAVTGGTCGGEYETEIRIYDGPLPVYVDPPVVYGEMNTQVTIYAAGLFGGAIDSVELLHPDGTIIDLDYEVDDERPNIIQAIVPAGVLDPTVDSAEFGIRLTDDEDCANQGTGLLTITNELTIAIESIEPPFGATDESTGVAINAVDPIDEQSDMVQFAATPRAYLNPSDAGGGTVAREIRAIQFLDETELNGIVPSGLPVGTYDLIVVNPDGTVGVLEESFDITLDPPPFIDTVIPGAWDNGDAALEVTIDGENFRADATIEVFCRESGSTETDEDLLLQPNDIIVDNVQDDRVLATVDATNLPRLAVCYMRLTNTDGTFAEYSPITVVNPSGKFMEFNPGVAFDTPRRGATSYSGVPSRTARYLYVVGGDDGDEQNGYTSGEFASLDRFGAPRSWNYLPYDLPSGRSMTNGERIHDFLYLVGGSDEGTTSDEILRARVLDPLDTPTIVNVDIELDDEDFYDDSLGGGESDIEGLDQGVYYYRVSAVYGPDDPANPEGESLASEPQPISVPLDDVAITISWEPPTYINHDIVEYRIYRSVSPDDPYGNESLIATVDFMTFSYSDDGSDEPMDGVNPLPVGALGMWHHVATLQHSRQVAGITWAPNPDNPAQYFIYAIGGENADGRRADYEFITIDNFGPRDQDVTPMATVGQFEGEDSLLDDPRTELSAVVAHEANASNVSEVPPQIFAFGGRSVGTDTDIQVATVTDTGHLEPWTTLGNNRRISGGTRAGHGAAVMNNELVYVGGAGGDPSGDGFHSTIQCEEAFCPPARVAIDYGNLSDLQMEDRVWMGHVAFRGFFYLMGGLTTGNVPTNTVDYSVAGGAP